MTTTPHTPQPDDNHDRPQVDPLRPDRLRCDCGATAARDGQCRKCRARATWAHRAAGRRLRTDRPPARREPRRRTGRDRRPER